VTTISDATAQVLATNQFNDPPAAGRQFFIVTLSYTYQGTTKGVPWLDLANLRLAGSRNILYDSFSTDTRCGVIPNDIDGHGDLLPGGSDTANICFSVPTDEVSSLEMTTRDGTLWWALH
jgi:hypothetical protein